MGNWLSDRILEIVQRNKDEWNRLFGNVAEIFYRYDLRTKVQQIIYINTVFILKKQLATLDFSQCAINKTYKLHNKSFFLIFDGCRTVKRLE